MKKKVKNIENQIDTDTILKELNEQRKKVSEAKKSKVKKASLGDSINKTRKNAGRTPVATQIILAHKRGDIGDDLAAAALRMYSDSNVDRKMTLAEEMRSRAISREGVSSITDRRTFSQVVKDIPDSLETLSYDEFNQSLKSLNAIPKKVYYKRNKINTIRKYKNDLKQRYSEAIYGYKEAISEAKKQVQIYESSGNRNLDAMALVKEAIIEAINYSSDLKSIFDELNAD